MMEWGRWMESIAIAVIHSMLDVVIRLRYEVRHVSVVCIAMYVGPQHTHGGIFSVNHSVTCVVAFERTCSHYRVTRVGAWCAVADEIPRADEQGRCSRQQPGHRQPHQLRDRQVLQ